MTVFNKLLAQVQDSAPKPQVMMNNAPTEQDILANLLGKKMKIESHSQPHFQSKDFQLDCHTCVFFSNSLLKHFICLAGSLLLKYR